MPLVRVITSRHENLEKNRIYRLIVRSHSFSLNSDDPLDTTLSLKLPPNLMNSVEVKLDKNKNFYLTFLFLTDEDSEIFSVDLESIDLPVSVLYGKIQAILDPDFELTEEMQDTPGFNNLTEEDFKSEEDFLAAIEQFVNAFPSLLKGGFGKGYSILHSSIDLAKNSLKSGFNQLKRLTEPLGKDNKTQKTLPFDDSDKIPLELIENQLYINKIIINYVDSKFNPNQITDIQLQNELTIPTNKKMKKVILFLHSFLLDWTVWKPYLHEFYPDYRVIAYDLRGHGASEIHKKDYKIKDYISDFVDFLEVLEIDRPPIELTLVTHSFTGLFLLHALDNKKYQPESLQ
ncbi:MAG: alpha/beta fold hydrolase, partial [Candidatus Hodarchaeales archaeon]